MLSNIRLVKEPSLYSPEPIKSPEDVVDVVKVIAKELATYDREVFLVLNLKLNGQIINMLDHIIVAAEIGEMYSFKEDGLLDQLRVRSQSWER